MTYNFEAEISILAMFFLAPTRLKTFSVLKTARDKWKARKNYNDDNNNDNNDVNNDNNYNDNKCNIKRKRAVAKQLVV